MFMDVLYYYDSEDRLRQWQVEIEADKYRVYSGLVGGKQAISGWKTATPKNVGKKNATTADEQAEAEVKALYKDRYNQGAAHHPEDVTKPFIKPMLASKFKDLKKELKWSDGVWVQPKMDGFRCVATPDGLKTREGKPVYNCGHIIEALADFWDKNPCCRALDGELYNHEYRDDFNKLSSMLRRQTVDDEFAKLTAEKVQYHIYDAIYAHEYEGCGYSWRHKVISKFVPNHPCLHPVETIQVSSNDAIDEYKQQFENRGYEGLIIRTNGPYEEDKRSKHLIKYKGCQDAEVIVKRVLEGKGNWAGAAKHVEIILPGGVEQLAGLKGTYEENAKILAEADRYPNSVCTVEFFSLTPDGKLRFPVVSKFWLDAIEQREPSKKLI